MGVDIVKALILGIVEGLTEFLPVSSTGHLIVAGDLLDYPQATQATFDIFIQLGSVFAVVWHYRNDFFRIACLAPRNAPERALIAKIAVAFLPAALVGLLLHDYIQEALFTVETVAGALIAGGVAILLAEGRRHNPVVMDMHDIPWMTALWVGLFQILSLFPGVSRAGATIIGGLLVGMSRSAATQFSFYLAPPTIAAASLFSLFESLHLLSTSDIAPLAVGLIASFVSALIVIRVFLLYVQTHDFKIFGYYRIAFGTLLLALR